MKRSAAATPTATARGRQQPEKSSMGGSLRVLPPRLSRRLFCSSFLHLVSVASAIHNGVGTGLVLAAAAVFATSVLYWCGALLRCVASDVGRALPTCASQEPPYARHPSHR